MGYQTVFSYNSNSSIISHVIINDVEDICISDLEILDFDQHFPFKPNNLPKNFIAKNAVYEKELFLSKILLNRWKPPKIKVIL